MIFAERHAVDCGDERVSAVFVQSAFNRDPATPPCLRFAEFRQVLAVVDV